MLRRCYLTVMSQEYKVLHIVHVKEHYEAFADGEFVVSGDTRNEVYKDLEEMGYLK